MTWFRDFNVPHWEIFGGNLLMLVTIVFYIAWWTVSFRPGGDGGTVSAGLFIAVAFFAGLAAITLLILGISAISSTGKGLPVMTILVSAVILYIILLAVTKIAFQRIVTSELLLIVGWAALEGVAIAVLQGSGRYNMVQALTLAALVLASTVAGLVCYILHYRLDEIAAFWNGLIPLGVDGVVVVAFLAMLALS
jgi:hypothetical protein